MATTSTSPLGTSLPGGDGPAVATFGLTRDYGGTGLFDVDLRVPRGCVYGLVGTGNGELLKPGCQPTLPRQLREPFPPPGCPRCRSRSAAPPHS
jgi:hypothetical protein